MAITKWINIENCQVSTCNKVGAIHGEDTVPHPALVTCEAQPTHLGKMKFWEMRKEVRKQLIITRLHELPMRVFSRVKPSTFHILTV